jgi:arginine utilization protein RocB
MDVDVNNYVNEFQHFLLRTKEEYAYWTRNNASQILTQLEKLKTKANELVSDIEQKTKQREEEFKNFTNSDSLFLHLRAILINFQKLIQIIEQVTYRSIPW